MTTAFSQRKNRNWFEFVQVPIVPKGIFHQCSRGELGLALSRYNERDARSEVVLTRDFSGERLVEQTE